MAESVRRAAAAAGGSAGHLRPSGRVMLDHAGDRGAVLLALEPYDHLHINYVSALTFALRRDRTCRRGRRVGVLLHRARNGAPLATKDRYAALRYANCPAPPAPCESAGSSANQV